MKFKENSDIPEGWEGGFAESNPAFAYPDPDLSSLDMLDNMANIKLLTRQQKVRWPEFSWQTEQGNPDSRCYQMFAPYISRLGYTDKGRVYSIICPQQGTWILDEICLNIEVTVTGQRGWANEDNREIAGDMTVEAKIWFTPSKYQGSKLQALWPILELINPKFALNKANAIRIETHSPTDPNEDIFPLLKGETTNFPIPEFAKHYDNPEDDNPAWSVGNLEVKIGNIKKTGDNVVDELNEVVMKAFNMASGNMLEPGNVLAWNVWFEAPKLVVTKEWENHAELWRASIDAHHGSPNGGKGEGTNPQYYDGTPFKPLEAKGKNAIDEIIDKMKEITFKHIRDNI